MDNNNKNVDNISNLIHDENIDNLDDNLYDEPDAIELLQEVDTIYPNNTDSSLIDMQQNASSGSYSKNNSYSLNNKASVTDSGGAYKAKNRKEELEKERSQDSNKKTTKVATQAAATALAGPAGGKIASAVNNTAVGNRIHETFAKKMEEASHRNPRAKKLQDSLNKLNDVGALDAAQTGLDMANANAEGAAQSATQNAASKSASGAQNAANAANNANSAKTSPTNQQKKFNTNFDINNKKSSINTSEDEKKKIIKQKIFSLIKKHPWILGVFATMFIIIIILLLMGGAAGADDAEYNESNMSYTFGDSCSEFPMFETSLSKDEFVNLTQTNITRWASAAKEFKNTDDLETIYDVATSNHCNPELVVARAIQEGFTGGKYNYWGIAVYNGMTSGSDFDSLAEGVIGFCKIVNNYDTFYNLNHAYAYIGEYWANGGDNSYGACTYIEYTYQYYTNQSRADEVKNTCAKNQCPLDDSHLRPKDPSNCLATNDEDQDAYTKYQNWALSNHRKNVYGLEPSDCSASSDFGDFSRCTIFNQFDTRWISRTLGTSTTTMRSGCAVTSVAIGISCFGNEYDSSFNPAKYLDLANSSEYVASCFDTDNIKWGCPVIQHYASNIHYVKAYEDLLGTSDDYKLGIINSFNPEQYFFIIQIKNASTKSHFIVLQNINKEKGTFTCLNPGGGTRTEEKIQDIKAIKVFTK